MKNKIVRNLVIIVTILIVVDQISKVLVTNLVVPSGNDYFKLEVSKNTGMAFGFNEGNISNIFITIFVLAIVINFIKNQMERIDNKTTIALALILGGGISNLIDRFFRGGILDFIKIYKFPVFNFADVCVVVGWILLILFLIDFSKNK